MSESDREYFTSRAEEERIRAARCDASAVRNVHLEMASRYAEFAIGKLPANLSTGADAAA